MRSAMPKQFRREAVVAKGLVLTFSVCLLLLIPSFSLAATISSSFDKIVGSREGAGYYSPFPVTQLINNAPGTDFVNPDGSFDGSTGLGGLGSNLPYHQTVDDLNSWAVRLYDDSNNLLPPPVLYLDLGSPTWTDGFIVWNSNAGDTAVDENDVSVPGGSGLKTARLSYANPEAGFNYGSNDPAYYEALTWTTINVQGSNFLGNFQLARSAGTYSEPQIVTFDTLSARLLKLELLEGFGYKSVISIDDGFGSPTPSKQDIIWLGEVAFYEASDPNPPSAVPEPSAVAVFAGLVGLRFARRMISRAKKNRAEAS
ncbi:MAG: hypothetical protein ACKOAU_12360 [Pirellula sp.]